MDPEASVSALVLHHPQARYFADLKPARRPQKGLPACAIRSATFSRPGGYESSGRPVRAPKPRQAIRRMYGPTMRMNDGIDIADTDDPSRKCTHFQRRNRAPGGPGALRRLRANQEAGGAGDRPGVPGASRSEGGGPGAARLHLHPRRRAAGRAGHLAPRWREIPEILELHHVAGEDCFLAKVRAEDTDALGRLLRERSRAHHDDHLDADDDRARVRQGNVGASPSRAAVRRREEAASALK